MLRYTPNDDAFARCFPFHFVFDEGLRIVQVGSKLELVCPGLVIGTHLEETFELLRPQVETWDYEEIERKQTSVFLMQDKDGPLRLRGQMLCDGDRRIGFFLGLPWVMSLDEVGQVGLRIDDFPIHDSMADYLLVLRTRDLAVTEATEMAARVRSQRDDLKKAKAEVEAAVRAKSLFLANVSHEIRTPMNGILGAARLFLDGELSADQRELAEIVDESASSLMELINDTLDLSKIEAGQMEINSIPFEPRSLLRSIRALFSGATNSKGVSLTTRCLGTVPARVCGDPTRVRQVLINVVGNAVKFTHDGEVSVTVDARVEDEGLMLDFTVDDTGIGISELALAKIFEPFSQADASTTRTYGGTGLGLSICRNLTELMGGSIECSSGVDDGSTFRFSVKVTADDRSDEALHEEQQTPLIETMGPPFEGRHVLLVEDNRVNQRVAERMLERVGCEVEIAVDGSQALVAYANRPPDLILMDIQMPVMDGYEATRRLREEDIRIPIIAMTANAMAEDRKRCFEVGMNDFLSKPVDPRKLTEMLWRWL